ncbi:MAG: hypothetical protein Tsb002_27430 [Wenzhouxiangellaceae bacterium]
MHKARLALACELVAIVLLLLMTVVGGAFFPDYSHVQQYISELGARGAPHAGMVRFLGFLPVGVAVVTFALLAYRLLPRSGMTLLGFLGIGYFGFGYIIAALFPCDAGCNPTDPSISQIIHDLVGAGGYLIGTFAVILLGIQAFQWRQATHVAVAGIILGGLSFLSVQGLSPGFEYVGLIQRAIEIEVHAWLLICALYLNRRV